MKKMVAFLALIAAGDRCGILLFTWMQKADSQPPLFKLSEDDAAHRPEAE